MSVNKKLLINIASLTLFIMIMLGIGLLVGHRLDTLSANYTLVQLEKQSKLMAGVVRQQLDSHLKTLSFGAQYMSKMNLSWEQVVAVTAGHDDDSRGILRLDGETVYGRSFNPREYSGIIKSFHGNNAVCYVKDEGLLLTVPVFNKGNVRYVAYRFVEESAIPGYFKLDFYDGQGNFAIIDKKENFIYADSKIDTSTILEKDEIKPVRYALERRIAKSDTAAALVKYRGEYQFVLAAEIPDTEMYIVGMIPYKVVSEGIGKIGTLFLFVFGLLFLLFIVTLIFIFKEEKKILDTHELEEEKRAAEKASSAKSDFLANMSHEIRTPINSILGMNEMILRECEDANIRSYAQDIYSAGHGLISIINDILDFSKIEAGKMEVVPQAYEVCSLLNDVTNMVGSRAKTKNLEFVVDVDTKIPTRLKGDQGRIQQILINLLNNAVKYTNEGYVRLAVKQTSWNKDIINLQIDVTDSGIGIKDEDRVKLFNSFQRLDLQKNRNIEGTGLGLAITEKLVAAMGGTIDVQSKYGKGSTFTVVIPQQIVDFTPIGNFKERFEKFKQSQNKSNKTFTAPNAKVLIVDDNAMNLHVAKSLLKQTMVQVTLCSSGKECLEMIQKERFDIIFLDHMMPEMDGLETLRRIKEMKHNVSAGSPIIALTANAIVGVREMYLKAGFDDYISKPIEGKVFEALVRQYLPEEKVIPVDGEIARKAMVESAVQQAAPEIVSRKDEKKAVSVEELSPAENQQETPAELIVVEKGMVYCGDDKETYKEIVQVYIDEAEENIKKLEDCLASENWKNYVITAHAIKSTSLTIGAEGLSARAKAQEFAGKEDRIEDLKNDHADFIELYRKVVQAAEKVVQEV